MKTVLALAAAFVVLVACATAPRQIMRPPTLAPTPSDVPHPSLSAGQAATLGSLELVNDYPLYTMQYVGSYSALAAPNIASARVRQLGIAEQAGCPVMWGCSLFAALGDGDNRLLGRNFDWRFSPALLLFTHPEDGYASVSMVDMEYLGFADAPFPKLMELSLEDRRPLLDAPFLPFDGMNEAGIAVGMAAVEAGNMPVDPAKETIDELQVMREILDHAATVQQAVDILDNHNIDMGSVPLHYLIASSSGESALVEFYEGKMHVFRNEAAWQMATNFLVASTGGHPGGECPRYDRMSRQLEELDGKISAVDAVHLLKDVSQDNTQWSILYHITTGDVDIVMGRAYTEPVISFHLSESAR